MRRLKIYRLGVLISLSVLLNSCIATKRYTEPTIENKYLFRLDSLNKKGKKLTDLDWQNFFKDELLKEYIKEALINNQDNNITLKNIELFKAQFKRRRAGYLPTVDINTDVQRQQQSKNTQFGSFANGIMTQYTASSNLTWELDLWGKITSQKLMAKAQFEKSITAQKLLQTELIANVTNTYYSILEADKRKQILVETVQIRLESFETLKQLKASGYSNALAVSQAKAQLVQARILLNDTENQIFTLENALSMLIGKPMNTIKRNSLEEQKILTEFQLDLPLEILSNRPDVKEAELEFKSLFENYNIAKASIYPSVKLTANIGFQSLETSSWFKSNSFFNTLVGGITAPIINGRQLRTQKEVSKIQMEQSLLRFQKRVLEASIEVSNVLNQYNTQRNNLKELKTQKQLLDKSFSDSKELLKAGLANYLEVLNAQENLLNTQLQYNQVLSQNMQTTTTIYRAVGGGIK